MDSYKMSIKEEKEVIKRHYLVMPFNNKWYILKMEFMEFTRNKFTINTTNAREHCENVYKRVCSDYSNKNIAIVEIETKRGFIFNSQHDENGNLQKIICNDFSQFEQMN